MLTIVVPMAGAGSRFAAAGHRVPKPLIKAHGVEMIRYVIHNLTPARPHRFVFIVQGAHVRDFDVANQLAEWAPGSRVVQIAGMTDGAARTVLAGADAFDNDQPLMIANSDQFVDTSVDQFLEATDNPMVDGVIMTMTASSPKWSYVRLDTDGRVTEVREKEVISDQATVGVYCFARGRDFVAGATAMIDADARVNGEFYVAPVYNQLIRRGGVVVPYGIGSDEDAMMGLGTPEDLEIFLQRPLSRGVAARITRG